MYRSPAVAGRFYPASKEQLKRDLADYLGELSPEPALGIVSPHAGYVFSGHIAGNTFSRVKVTDTVIVLGPNHYGRGAPLSLWEGEGWTTPLGDVHINQAVASRLRELLPQVTSDFSAHAQEHSLEVQVPFIQTINPLASIVPLAIGMSPLSTLQQLGHALVKVIQEVGEPVLIVASSDMTHFESADMAARKDQFALQSIYELDPEGLFRTVRDNRISMCGVLPVTVMLYAAIAQGATRAELVEYATSGDVTGDYDDVVGYAGAIIS